jgi:hypothetical protein
MKKSLAIIMGIGVFACFLPACGSNGENPPEFDAGQAQDGHESLDEEGCEHLTEGPFVDISAGADAPSAAEVKTDHQAYRVALTAGQVGFVKLTASDAGDHVLFLDTHLLLELQDDQGTFLPITSSASSITACAEVKGWHIFELPGAGTYFLKLGPGPDTEATQVILVIEQT